MIGLKRFKCVYELKHEGILAPWNYLNYKITTKNNDLIIKNHQTKKIYKVIFFHFHNIKLKKNGLIKTGSFLRYDLNKKII